MVEEHCHDTRGQLNGSDLLGKPVAGGLGFVLLGAAMNNKAAVWFGAASLLLIGPGLLWFSERFTVGIPTTDDTPVDQRSTPDPQDLAKDGRTAPPSRKTKPQPRR